MTLGKSKEMSEKLPALNPVPGLRPFEMEDKFLFFGREEQVGELLSRLRKSQFLAVLGPSGSGKSSLVRAGLLPQLYGGMMVSAGSTWELSIMRPASDPFSNLAKSLWETDLFNIDQDDDDAIAQIRATLNRSRLGLVEAARQSELDEDCLLYTSPSPRD